MVLVAVTVFGLVAFSVITADLSRTLVDFKPGMRTHVHMYTNNSGPHHALTSNSINRRRAQVNVSLSPMYLSRFIVVPNHRLIVCYIEKVAATTLNAMTMFLQSGASSSLRCLYARRKCTQME